MSTKGNWLILAGAGIILLAIINFSLAAWKNLPSRFDRVETSPQADDFLPLLVPVTGEGITLAPTLQVVSTGASEDDPPVGLVPNRLVIPAIYLDAPVVPVHYKDIEADGAIYHQWLVPTQFAAGWQDESAQLGLPGNTVLNGHHNAYGMVFENLVKLSEGDVILVYSGEVQFRYVVVEKLLIPERGQTLETRLDNARWIQSSDDERLTLVTCWPAESNTHRVIIVAFPENEPQPPVESAPAGN